MVMMRGSADRESEREERRHAHRPAGSAACEACRKLKMRCIRPNGEDGSKNLAEPCERCRRSNRPCSIPPPRPLGRKPGAVGRYRGFEKAYRKMQAELKKARASSGGLDDVVSLPRDDEDMLDLLLSNGPGNQEGFEGQPEEQSEDIQRQACSSQAGSLGASPEQTEPISNPLALLADASGAAQALSLPSESITPSANIEPVCPEPAGSGIGRQLLHRPGYISLGLQLSRGTLETGLDALFAPSSQINRYSDYFRPTEANLPRDVGPDLDPVELGLISMDEVHALFPLYFTRLHPFNGILDPILHTPDYVRSHSSLLFTWILALTAQFDHASWAIAKRLQVHGEKLSRHVHTCGYKSVEIVQGYYISLLSATPAKNLSEERSWLYTMYAFGVAAELGLDQGSQLRPRSTPNAYTATASPPEDLATPQAHGQRYLTSSTLPGPTHPPHQHQVEGGIERLARNRERTWLRILLWERANSAAWGRMNAFPETELTLNIESWWIHPLADLTDKYTCALILLRRNLASLHSELRRQTSLSHSDPHWVRELINTTFELWRKTWLPSSSTVLPYPERLPNIYLYYVFIHSRLWTLSFALHTGSIKPGRDLNALREDCFAAAIHSCEVAVRDLQAIGEPIYAMLAPTWAMISYAAVLALKLFPWLHGERPGYEVELLALLAQVALQLERTGTTPGHRFGIAALLGEHLMMILRGRVGALGVVNAPENQVVVAQGQGQGQGQGHGQQGYSMGGGGGEMWESYEPMISTYDPFLGTEGEGDGFGGLFREIFGPSFGDVL